MAKKKVDPKANLAKDRYRDEPKSGKDAEVLLEMAKIHLMGEFPFLGKLITKMPLIENNMFPTTAVDAKGRFYFNRKWVNGMDFQDALFEAAHEVGHMIQRCAVRKPKAAIHFIWNKAADWIDDLALVQTGIERSSISKEAISDEELKKAEELGTIEAVYKYLLDKTEQETDCEACKQLIKKAKQAAKQNAKAEQDEVDKLSKDKEQGEGSGGEQDEQQAQDGSGQEDGEGDGTADGDGEGSGQQPKHTCGNIRMCCAGSTTDASEATPEELQATVENVLEAYHKAKERGNQPSGIFDEMVRKLTKSNVRWQDHLKTQARQVFGKGRYSWKKMGRRSDLRGLRFPNRDPETKACAMVIDASGSVDEGEYIQALSEAAEIVRQSGCRKLLLVIHDFEVYYVGEVDEQKIREAPKSNGGTSHIDVFEVLNGNSKKFPLKERPAMVVCFTDGMSCFPPQEPEYPVIWALFEGWEEAGIPWGKKVRVPINRGKE